MAGGHLVGVKRLNSDAPAVLLASDVGGVRHERGPCDGRQRAPLFLRHAAAAQAPRRPMARRQDIELAQKRYLLEPRLSLDD